MRELVTGFFSLVVGGVVATVTLMGVVQAQTAAPELSPVSVNSETDDLVAYGSN